MAETLTLEEGVDGYQGTTDTTIYKDVPNNANGGFPQIFVGPTGTSVRRALIRFDLSSLPSGIELQSAALILTVERSSPSSLNTDTISVHRLLKDWGEGNAVSADPGGSGTTAQAGDATWNSNRHQQSQWTQPGGDFSATPSDTKVVSRTPDTIVELKSDAVLNDVKQWLADPSSNNGWIVIGQETGQRKARRYHSSEGIAGKRPRLVLEYTVASGMDDWMVYR